MVKLSVIMSDYNTNIIYFKEAIDSLINQTFKNFEVIIIDDGSINNVKRIVKSYQDKRFRVLVNKENKGFSYSLNRAIKNSKSSIIVRFDTDDICFKDRLEKQYKFLQNNDYDAVGSLAIEFNDKEDVGIIGKKGLLTKEDILHSKTPIHPTIMIKKDALFEMGLYKECIRVEDYILWCDMLLHNKKIYIMDEPLIKYRVNLSSYKKRKRKDDIKYHLIYYKKLNAKLLDYRYILKLFLSVIIPNSVLYFHHNNFVCRKGKNKDV